MSASKYSLDELIQHPSFRRWIQGEASKQERVFWDRWVMKDPDNRRLAMEAQEEIEGFMIKPVGETSTDDMWRDIRTKLDKGPKARVHNLPFHNDSGIDRLAWIYRIAAGILLLVTCIFLVTQFYQAQPEGSADIVKREVTTDYGEKKAIKLSDGSEIILNGYTNIVYTIDRNDPTAIDLFLEGEAYFSVSKRKNPGDAPFQVRTEEGLVKVLGTQLVVSTRNNNTSVVLKEGSVSVNPFHLDSETILEPGQLGEFSSRSDSVKTKFVNLQVYTSWLQGQLHFEKASLREVAERMEETFGVKVVIRDSTLYKHEVSGAIEGSELEVITSALSEMLDVSIQKSDSGKIIYLGDH